MIKDYVKYKKPPQRQLSKAYFWVFIIVFFGASLGIGLHSYYKQDISFNSVKHMIVTKISAYFPHLFKKKNSPAEVKKIVAHQEDTIPSIHFNFYDELPKAQLDFSEKPSFDKDLPLQESQRADKNKAVIPVALSEKRSEGSQYILQVGVFHNREVAHRYSQALLSVGFKVDIVKEGEGKEEVYHVQQGPFHHMEELKVAKKRFNERGVTCVIRKLPPYTLEANP